MNIDAETVRQQRNFTDLQKKNTLLTKEGVLVNSFIKNKINLNDTYDSLVISQNTELPRRIYDRISPDDKKKNILPVAAATVGVMGAFAGITAYVRHNAKILTAIKPGERIADFTRNLAINDEARQAVVRMVISPNKQTLLAGAGVLALTAMAFMGKTFSEGFRDVWIKKREADIQKNLQEKLISIETQSFGGKIQIIRSMLSAKAKEFGSYLEDEAILPNFGKYHKNISFGRDKNERITQQGHDNTGYIALGAGVVCAIAGLGFLSLKNLTKSKSHFEELAQQITNKIEEVINNKNINKEEAKKVLGSLFQKVSASKEGIEKAVSQTDWTPAERSEFAAATLKKIKAPSIKASDALGGSGVVKPSFYSHVDDYRAFCYNWLLNTENRQFKQMFFGITGLSALGYGGKLTTEAIKDVEVKKMNAATEIDLQNRLISTELRNFKAKKDAVVEPLTNEFYRQAANGKPKTELKIIADNILFEIKNGPPFVYS
ncbi:MAG: hypothetical protein LBK53_06720 [Heliobacteriaceae bacterium]|jgi:hypothetical protein|nr:hypothetical protein [Heliobacteriaceae bacterium]